MDLKQIVSQGYDRVAERHAEWAGCIRREERSRCTSVLLAKLPPGAAVLELGCGAGIPTTRQLAERFAVTGLDISAWQVRLARQNVPAAKFICTDMTQLEFPPESFDAVTAFYSIIHVPRQEQPKLLRDIAMWLRPGGLLVALELQPKPHREFSHSRNSHPRPLLTPRPFFWYNDFEPGMMH